MRLRDSSGKYVVSRHGLPQLIQVSSVLWVGQCERQNERRRTCHLVAPQVSGSVELCVALRTREAVHFPLRWLRVGTGLDMEGLVLNGLAVGSGHVGRGYIGRGPARQDDVWITLFTVKWGNPKSYVGQMH